MLSNLLQSTSIYFRVGGLINWKTKKNFTAAVPALDIYVSIIFGTIIWLCIASVYELAISTFLLIYVTVVSFIKLSPAFFLFFRTVWHRFYSPFKFHHSPSSFKSLRACTIIKSYASARVASSTASVSSSSCSFLSLCIATHLRAATAASARLSPHPSRR